VVGYLGEPVKNETAAEAISSTHVIVREEPGLPNTLRHVID
jgi:hypothetical protein